MKSTTINVLMKDVKKHSWIAKKVSTLEDMQELVGGYIERVQLPQNIDLWVNEDGIIGLDINLMILWDDNPDFHQPIYGPVFLAGYDANGETTSLNDSQKQWLAQHLHLAQLTNGRQIIAIDLREKGESV